MPLLDLQTNLKSLKYSDSGTSTPLVTKDINNPPNGSGFALEAGSRIDDLTRISKLMISPAGLKFAINNAVLGNGPGKILRIAGATLAQVPVNGTGTHFVYGFQNETYLTNRQGPTSAIGAFIQNNLGIGGGTQGANSVLKGEKVIVDNYGGEGYESPAPSRLETLNSRFDLTPGQDGNFTKPTSYLRDDLQDAFNFVKGLFGSNKNAVVSPDNTGDEGFRPMSAKAIEYESAYDIEGETDRYTGNDSRINPGTTQVETKLQEQETEIDTAESYTGEDGRTNTADSSVETKLQDQETEINTGESYTGQDGRTNTADSSVETDLQEQQTEINTGESYTGQDGRTNTTTSGIDSNLIDQEIGDPVYTGTGGQVIGQAGQTQQSEENFQTQQTDGGISGDSTPPPPISRESSLNSKLDPAKGVVTNVSNSTATESRTTSIVDFRKYRTYNKNGGVKGKGQIVDENTNGYSSKTNIDGIDYTTQQIDVKYGMMMTQDSAAPQGDKINLLPEVTANAITDARVEDIIPFYFNSITPDNNFFLHFRAFLDSFADNYSGDWTGTKYVGRAEEFYTYQGFKRDITFDFKIAAFSKEELAPLYRKLNFLAGTTAPTYGSNGGFMRGTLCNVTVGDYLIDQTGFIKSVGISWDKVHPWETQVEDGVKRLPHILSISVAFTPIHSFNANADIDQGGAFISN